MSVTMTMSARLMNGLVVGVLVSGLLVSAGCRKPDDQARRLLQSADEALARQKWDEAFARAHEAVQISGLSDAVRDQARLKEEQARAELQAQAQYARFMGAVDTDHDTAVAAYRDLPANSYYRQQAKDAYERIKPQFISDHLEKAQQALTNKRCDDAKAQLQLILDVDSGNARALELSKQPCTVKPAE
jgi:hypothetical protein